MRVYVVQHGHALAKDVDPERPLSERGYADVGRVAAFLAGAGVRVESVMHSGKTRARQTAELLAAAIATGAPVASRSGIDPRDDPRPIEREIASWERDTMLVAHLPFVSKLVSQLCGAGEEDIVAFEPGTAVCLERRDAGWTVAWMLRPSLIPGD